MFSSIKSFGVSGVGGYSVAVEQGSGRCERETLEGVPEGMAEVEGFANALLARVFGNDALLERNAFAHHFLQLLKVGLLPRKIQMPGQHFLAAEQGVLNHFGVARK